jgi:hypothetical protein
MAATRITFADTGDYLELHDPKTVAGQAAWKRATPAAIEMTQNPGEVAGAKLAALVGRRSSLGDPRKPGFIKASRTTTSATSSGWATWRSGLEAMAARSTSPPAPGRSPRRCRGSRR